MEQVQIKVIPHVKVCQLKNGELKTYSYNGKVYNDNFWNKHKDTLLEKHKCEVCGGSFNLTNKSRHLKSKKHINKLT
jgi:hypothetical protein